MSIRGQSVEHVYKHPGPFEINIQSVNHTHKFISILYNIQKAVSAYFTSKLILPFSLAQQYTDYCGDKWSI